MKKWKAIKEKQAALIASEMMGRSLSVAAGWDLLCPLSMLWLAWSFLSFTESDFGRRLQIFLDSKSFQLQARLVCPVAYRGSTWC